MTKALSVSLIVATRPGLKPRVEELWKKIWPSQAQPLELVVAEGSSPSAQRNKAAQASRGEVLYFLDDDSVPETGALAEIQRIFADSRVDAAGGPDLAAPGANATQQALDFVQGSWLGSGPVRRRYRSYEAPFQASEKHLILCNMAVRRAAFNNLGGFNPGLYPNEENEFLNRLSRKGSVLIASPALVIRRARPSSVPEVLKQAFGYGRGRSWQFKTLPDWGDLAHLAPLAAACLGTAVLILRPPWGGVLALAAASLVLLEGFRSWLGGLTWLAPLLVVLILPLRHLAYAAGTLAGLAGSPPRRDDRVQLRILDPK